MEARFAGSQRVGDRRRRRLAAGADDTADNPAPAAPGRTIALSAPAGSFLAADSAHTDGKQTEASTSLNLPIAKLIPAETWKYLVGALLGLVASAAIIIAGYFAPALDVIAGTGISDLVAPANGRLGQWFSSLLLLLCAQLALLIWWARSRSLEDFEGRYWLWIRTACAWLGFSACVSIEAHGLVLNTVMNFRPDLSRQLANLCWMIPAATAGVLLVGALAREMRGCRASRVLLLSACACQLSTAGLQLEIEAVFSPALRTVLIQSGFLTGHVALFVSMWLHARHVLRCTAEPAPRLKSTWRIPRPHFRLPRRRLTQARSESAPVDPAAPSVERTSKPRIRLDNRHREPVPQVGAPARIESSGGLEQSRVISPITLESQRIGPTDSDDSATTSLHPTTAVHATTCEAASAESEEASEEGSSRPELRGLSKKQRRRLMQELRDRERESRR